MQTHNIHTDALNIINKDIKKYSPHPSLVNIIAVTKTFNYTAIISAQKHKLPCIGENQVQEFLLKHQKNPTIFSLQDHFYIFYPTFSSFS